MALGFLGKPPKHAYNSVPGGGLRAKLALRRGPAALAARAGTSPYQRDAINGMQFTGCKLWGATYGMQRMNSKVGKPVRHPRVGAGLRRKPMGEGKVGRREGGEVGGLSETCIQANVQFKLLGGVQVSLGGDAIPPRIFFQTLPALWKTRKRPTQRCPELTWQVQWISLPGASSAPGVPPKLAPGGVLSDTKPDLLIRYLVGGSFSGRFPEMGGAARPPPTSRMRESLVEWLGILISTSPDTIR